MIKLRYWVLGCNPNAHDIGERIFCIKTMSLYAYPVIFLYSHWHEGLDRSSVSRKCSIYQGLRVFGVPDILIFCVQMIRALFGSLDKIPKHRTIDF